MTVRAALASLFVLALGAALGRTVPDVLDRPLLRGVHGAGQVIPLPVTSTDGTAVQRTLALRTDDAAELGRYEEIRLVVGTYDTAPALERGSLTVAGSCVFRAHAERLRDNTTVRFSREASCGALPHAAADVVLALTFAGASPRDARAALWTSPLLAGSAPLLRGQVEHGRFGVDGRAIVQRGPARVSRARLLAYMWDLPPWSLWLIVAAAGAMVVAGAIALDRAAPAGAAFASFALAAGLALSYSVIVPPLEAPDEPDHLLSFAKLADRPALAEATSVWARRIHFYRLTFMADERFTPADREQPFERDWDPADIFAENVPHRSSTVTRLWQALAPLVPARAPHALLLFRCADALVFATAFALGGALLARTAAVPLPGLLAAILLSVPTLPFFGMHLSELTLTIAAFVVAGYGAVLLLGGAAGGVAGPVLGLAVALIAAGPRSGWPSLVAVAALAAGRMLSAGGERTRPLGDTLWFWAGVAVPGIALFGTRLLWIPSPLYDSWQLPTFDPRAGISSSSFLIAVTAGACCGALGERLLQRATPLTRPLAYIARACAAAGALVIAATLAWSIWAPLPMLKTIESVAPESAPAYVRSVLVTLATSARVRGFDFLTWTSLWGGFGWADAILPAPALSIVTVLAAGAAILTLIAAARPADGRQALIIVCGVAGLGASAAAAAVSSYGLHRNVHGRYLLGACLIGLCLLVAPAVLAPGRHVPPAARAAALLALCCGLHAFSLMFLLERYFG